MHATRTNSLWMKTEKCSNHEFLLEQVKNYQGGEKPRANTVAWSYDMERHAKKVRREMLRTGEQKDGAVKQSLKSLLGSPPFQGRGTGISWRNVKGMLTNCPECLYLARTGRLDILWSVDKLARSIKKWTKAYDKRLIRVISYIHHTSDCRQHCHVGNPVQHCRLGLFHDSDVAGVLRSQNQPRGESYVYSEVIHLSPISWMCKKQTSVSHSSTEAELVSLDAGLRMDGIPALDLWDLVIEALRSSKSTESPTHQAAGNCSRNHKSKPNRREIETLTNCRMWTTSPQTQILLKVSLSCTSLKTMKQ